MGEISELLYAICVYYYLFFGKKKNEISINLINDILDKIKKSQNKRFQSHRRDKLGASDVVIMDFHLCNNDLIETLFLLLNNKTFGKLTIQNIKNILPKILDTIDKDKTLKAYAKWTYINGEVDTITIKPIGALNTDIIKTDLIVHIKNGNKNIIHPISLKYGSRTLSTGYIIKLMKDTKRIKYILDNTQLRNFYKKYFYMNDTNIDSLINDIIKANDKSTGYSTMSYNICRLTTKYLNDNSNSNFIEDALMKCFRGTYDNEIMSPNDAIKEMKKLYNNMDETDEYIIKEYLTSNPRKIVYTYIDTSGNRHKNFNYNQLKQIISEIKNLISEKKYRYVYDKANEDYHIYLINKNIKKENRIGNVIFSLRIRKSNDEQYGIFVFELNSGFYKLLDLKKMYNIYKRLLPEYKNNKNDLMNLMKKIHNEQFKNKINFTDFERYIELF